MESLTPAQQVIKIVNDELTELMGGSESRAHPHQVQAADGDHDVRPAGCGQNHAHRQAGQTLYQGGPPPAARRMRYLPPAAVDQLKIVGEKAGAPVFALPGEKARRPLPKRPWPTQRTTGTTSSSSTRRAACMWTGGPDGRIAAHQGKRPVDETLLVIDAMAGRRRCECSQKASLKAPAWTALS